MGRLFYCVVLISALLQTYGCSDDATPVAVNDMRAVDARSNEGPQKTDMAAPRVDSRLPTPADSGKPASDAALGFFFLNEVIAFNGMGDYRQYPDSDMFSAVSGELTILAWIQPAVLQFPKSESVGYVNWMGKGEPGEYEWTFRIYNEDNADKTPSRIVFAVFNRDGTKEANVSFQDLLEANKWIHVAAKIEGGKIQIFKDGIVRQEMIYVPDVTLGNGTAPLRIGTREFNSFFQGKMAKIRIYNKPLLASEIYAIYAAEKTQINP